MNEDDEHYHTFGHHPDDRDPWDALLMDVTALDDSGEYKALVSFWHKRGQAAAAAARADFEWAERRYDHDMAAARAEAERYRAWLGVIANHDKQFAHDHEEGCMEAMQEDARAALDAGGAP